MTFQRIPKLSDSLLGAAALIAALSSCGGLDPSGRPDAGSARDAVVDKPVAKGSEAGIPTGGGILPPPPDAEMPPITTDAPYVVVNGSCCKVTLSIADSTFDEKIARVEGDTAPLSAPGGVPLAWANGRWTAQVCLPMETLVSYRFYFGQKPAEYAVGGHGGGAGGDGGSGGTDGRAEERDGGAGDVAAGEEDVAAGDDSGAGPTGIDTALEMVDDYRLSDEAPRRLDSQANAWNVLAPVMTCAP